MRALVIVAAASGVAHADDTKPALDDFYERTRERHDGFDNCPVGYCDGEHLATLSLGAQTANPSNDVARPLMAIGARLGGELGLRRNFGVARTRVWVDVLRVIEAGDWVINAAWHTTAFNAFGRQRDDTGLHVSFDNVIASKTEIDLADIARLQQVPYRSIDTEAEVAPLGPYVDKSARWAIPIGVANRLRWQDGPIGFDRRTSVAGAIAFRGFEKQTRSHQQLDALRVKITDWGDARATTVSAGYQRLPVGIDTLPLWALVGYQWAGERHGVVAQLGMDLPLTTGAGEFRIAPSYTRSLDRERDPTAMTDAAFVRVSTAKVALEHRIRQLRYGASYESVSIDERREVRAITPTIGVTWRGLELGVAYRIVISEQLADPMAPALPQSRLSLSLDQRF